MTRRRSSHSKPKAESAEIEATLLRLAILGHPLDDGIARRVHLTREQLRPIAERRARALAAHLGAKAALDRAQRHLAKALAAKPRGGDTEMAILLAEAMVLAHKALQQA